MIDPSLVETAVDAADRAATQAGVSVRPLVDQVELEAAERLLSEIWQVGDEPVVPSNLLRAMVHSNNYVSGAFAEDRLVGTSVGFLGSRRGHLHLHSHITGVAPSMQGRNVGFALKQDQRTWALRNGLSEIEWTFDPLVRRNGYFNIMKLGAEIVDYKTNFYGHMRDGINDQDDSDRCVVHWRVSTPRAIEAAAGPGKDPAIDEARTKIVLTENEVGSPVVSFSLGEVLYARIPTDIVSLRRADRAKAAAWRQALRDVFTRAFAEGYAVTGMTKSGGYLLSRSR